MPFVQWSDSLSIGIEAIDSQHKQLVRMLNELSDAFESPDRESITSSSLEKMKKYSKEHFADEEQFMKENNYPELEDHKEKHDIFIDKVCVYDDVQLLLRAPYYDMLNFLKQWLVEHITECDQRIATFLKQ